MPCPPSQAPMIGRCALPHGRPPMLGRYALPLGRSPMLMILKSITLPSTFFIFWLASLPHWKALTQSRNNHHPTKHKNLNVCTRVRLHTQTHRDVRKPSIMHSSSCSAIQRHQCIDGGSERRLEANSRHAIPITTQCQTHNTKRDMFMDISFA